MSASPGGEGEVDGGDGTSGPEPPANTDAPSGGGAVAPIGGGVPLAAPTAWESAVLYCSGLRDAAYVAEDTTQLESLILGDWYSCTPGGFLGEQEEGIRFSADGTFELLYSDGTPIEGVATGNGAPHADENQRGTWEILPGPRVVAKHCAQSVQHLYQTVYVRLGAFVHDVDVECRRRDSLQHRRTHPDHDEVHLRSCERKQYRGRHARPRGATQRRRRTPSGERARDLENLPLPTSAQPLPVSR